VEDSPAMRTAFSAIIAITDALTKDEAA